MATLSAVVMAYFLFWCLPHWAYFGAVVTGLPQGVLGAILYFAIVANAIHSSLNFIIYMCMHMEFRKHFFMLFPFSCHAKMNTPLRMISNCHVKRIDNFCGHSEVIQKPLSLISSRPPIADSPTVHHWKFLSCLFRVHTVFLFSKRNRTCCLILNCIAIAKMKSITRKSVALWKYMRFRQYV